MNEIQLKQNVDFLSIALESIEAGSHDIAAGFIEDVADSLEDSNQSESLRGAIDMLESGDVDAAFGVIEEVNAELLSDIENL